MKIEKSKGGLASMGRNGDTRLAHVAEGEMIVPSEISPELRARIHEEMMAIGVDPERYTVGGGNMSINPETGMPEFFLKKIFKAAKKIVSSPIGQLGLSFALPGLGTAVGAGLGLGSLGGSALLGGGLGALSGNGLKGILGGAVGGAAGGLGNYLGSGISNATGLGAITSNSLGRAVASAAGTGIGGGNIKDAALSGGLSGLGSLYQSGAFNNLGKSFNESGLSGALTQFDSNLSGKGDILSTNGSASPSVGGGGESSYQSGQYPSTAEYYSGAIENPLNDGATDMAGLTSGRGLNSLLSAGINTYSNNKAAEQLLKQQKQGLADLSPYLNRQFTPGDLTQDPGYQFQLTQGQKALDRASAARGNYYSGDALRSAGEYATGLADQTYNEAFQRDQTQNNANINAILQKYGILSNIGNTKAANTIGNADAITQSLGNFLQPQDDISSLLAKYLGRGA